MRNLTEIRISGFGGQGVILSAIVIGKAGCILRERLLDHDPGVRPGSPRRRLQRAGHPVQRADSLPLRHPARHSGHHVAGSLLALRAAT